jgi:hypothetical protein
MVLFNRKDGVVFTIIALVISSFILILFFYMIELPVDHGVEVTRLKIHTINTFLSQSEDIVKAQAVASSKQAISSIISHMYDRNRFINIGAAFSFDEAFVACLEEGEYKWVANIDVCGDNAHFKGFIEEELSSFLEENAGLSVDFTVSNIVLNQSTPWALDINFLLEMYLKEEGFSWNISMNVSESFSIIGFPDPMQAVVHSSMTGYRPDLVNVSRIKVNEFHRNFSGFSESSSTLNSLLKEKAYLEHSMAPSYLDRLRGNMSPSDLGIMTIVLPIYETPGDYTSSPVRSGSSSLDWHFWQNYNNNILTYGIYNFTEYADMNNVLTLNYPFNLIDTIHNVIIPRPLAVEANVSGSSYFNYI